MDSPVISLTQNHIPGDIDMEETFPPKLLMFLAVGLVLLVGAGVFVVWMLIRNREDD